jgi:hypothetical protein
VRRVYWISVGLLAACLLSSASALAAREAAPTMSVAGVCAGDTISGRVAVRASRGTLFTLRLLRRASQRSNWTRIGRPRRFRSTGLKQTIRFRFDVSTFDAYAYRLRLTRPHGRAFSKPISAASCAPGEQVPEAPFALLLPLSLLASSGTLLLRRRRTSP